MMYGLDTDTIRSIKEVFKKHSQISKVVLYGSRAKGNYKNGSDIDITLFGDHLHLNNSIYPLMDALDELDLAYTFDISVFDQLKEKEFIDHINSVGKVFYQKEKGVPEGWEMMTLGEVCEIFNGSTPLKRKKEYWDNGTINWFTINDIRNQGRIINYTNQKITDEGFKSTSIKLLPKKSILLCCTASVGEYAITEVELTTNQQFNGLVVKDNNQLVPEYLFYFSSTLKKKLLNVSGKTTIDFVSMTKVRKIEIPLPPLPEQQRIVAILDKVFAAIDTAKANATQNLLNAKELFESYLQNVFEDKGDDWGEKKLNEIAENLDRQRVPITKKDRIKGEIPYYGASGIVDYVQDYIFDEELLCISEDGANLLARTYPIAFSISGKTWVNNHAHILKFKNLISQKYVEYYLNSIKLDNFISGMAQPKLNQIKLNTIPIPIPNSIDEQKIIVNKIDKLFIQTKKLTAIYTQKIAYLEEMKKSVLQKAFKGEL